jgi:predicted cupin superfamily sugar epimerase
MAGPLTPEILIERLGLVPLPVEGGHYRQTWVSAESVAATGLPARYGRAKPLGTAIYYLLTDDPDSFSALHRLPTDEVYHFYVGDPVEMLLLHPEGRGEAAVLGTDILAGQREQLVVPRAPGGRFALMGTTMAPGFDPADYEGGGREGLIAAYPEQAEGIRRLTRS